jgi:hypothetical protein
VEIDGIGTTTLRIRGARQINTDVEFAPSEDPIEAMSLITAAIVTESEVEIRRAPIEFLEIELAILAEMGLDFTLGEEYVAPTATPAWSTSPSGRPHASPIDKIHPMPFPGLNIDNLPFFAVIAATAQGKTVIHDWVYENRAIYLTELNRLGARVQLLDPHRVIVEGPTRGAASRSSARRRYDPRSASCSACWRPGAVGAARCLRDQPRLRGSGQPAQCARRQHRGLPRLSVDQPVAVLGCPREHSRPTACRSAAGRRAVQIDELDALATLRQCTATWDRG